VITYLIDQIILAYGYGLQSLRLDLWALASRWPLYEVPLDLASHALGGLTVWGLRVLAELRKVTI
jgi:hypothetical protein